MRQTILAPWAQTLLKLNLLAVMPGCPVRICPQRHLRAVGGARHALHPAIRIHHHMLASARGSERVGGAGRRLMPKPLLVEDLPL